MPPRASPLRLEDGLADLHAVALTQLHGLADALVVDERAVGRAGVLDPEGAVAVERARMHLRHEGVECERHRATAAAAYRHVAVDGVSASPFGLGRYDDQPPLASLRGAARADRRRRRRGDEWSRRGCGATPKLAGDDPDDPHEEHIEQREQTELQDC